MFTDNTTRVDSEPSNGSNDDITNSYECDQTLNRFKSDAHRLNDVCLHQFRPRSSMIYDVCSHQFKPRSSMTNDAWLFNDKMTSVHISSSLALQRQMASADNTSGPAPQRKERSVPVPVNSTGTPSSTTIDQDAPSPSHLPSSSALQSPCSHQGIAVGSTIIEDNPCAPVDNNPFVNVFAPEPSSEASSSEDVSSRNRARITRLIISLV
ncbi:hypothetical protein Tco_1529259 [Tanacetum coccineum]